MIENSDIWKLINDTAQSEGLELFDLELPYRGPRSGGGVLRIFLSRPKGEMISTPDGEAREKGVGLGDCTRVCKKLRDLVELETLIPGDWSLEVSSPGINRKLRLTSHFAGAVGERVRAVVRDEENRGTVIVGELRAFNGQFLEVFDEESKAVVRADVAMVGDARIDFKFE